MTITAPDAPASLSVREFDCPDCADDARCREAYEWARKRPQRTECDFCQMSGTVTVDPAAILTALLATRGPSKGTFRASRPPLPGDKGGVYGAAYCWRIIRFDTGADASMPVMAGDYVGLGWVVSDATRPLRAYLDTVATVLGELLFGKLRMMRGAAMWGRVLGFDGAERVAQIVESTVGLPMGDGYAVGDSIDSPEAYLERVLVDISNGDTTLLDAAIQHAHDAAAHDAAAHDEQH